MTSLGMACTSQSQRQGIQAALSYHYCGNLEHSHQPKLPTRNDNRDFKIVRLITTRNAEL